MNLGSLGVVNLGLGLGVSQESLAKKKYSL